MSFSCASLTMPSLEEFAKGTVEATQNAQDFEVRMQTLTSSSQKAAQAVAFVAQNAAKVSFPEQDIRTAAIAFTAMSANAAQRGRKALPASTGAGSRACGGLPLLSHRSREPVSPSSAATSAYDGPRRRSRRAILSRNSCSVRAPLRRLHAAQVQARFSGHSLPALLRGCLWSTWKRPFSGTWQ
jgi:hypothetical protein